MAAGKNLGLLPHTTVAGSSSDCSGDRPSEKRPAIVSRSTIRGLRLHPVLLLVSQQKFLTTRF
jgi:hypothetical protein